MTDTPNLFICGVAKAGTSALFHALCQHPEIVCSSMKEPHFFTHPIDRTIDKEKLPKSLDAYLALFAQIENAKYYCEASTSYAWDLGVAKRIFEFNSSAKIIIVLRNPITRAYSHYEMDVHAEREKNPSFLSAIKIDEKRKDRIWGQSRLYVDLGYYSSAIETYRSLFKNNLLVLKYEELQTNSIAFYDRIWHFLEIDTISIQNSKINTAASYSGTGRALKATGIGKYIPEAIKPWAKKILKSGKNKIPTDASEYLLSKYYDDLKKLSKLGYPFYEDLISH